MSCLARHAQTKEPCALEDGHTGPHELPYKHRCHALGCVRPCRPEHLMCRAHWARVPKPLQAAVWATYREGQCDDKRPSAEWHTAADEAIAAVWKQDLTKLLDEQGRWRAKKPEWVTAQVALVLPGIEP